MSGSEFTAFPFDPNPSGLCQCGCGQSTPRASQTITAKGIGKGNHFRYAIGHYDRTPAREPPNPSGLCFCGCGAEVPRATRNREHAGLVKGEYIRYLKGHAPFELHPGSQPCECGCGEMAPEGKPRKRGHNACTKGYQVCDATGCWEWQGFISPAGYGRIKTSDNRSHLAHRHMWERVHGAVPTGHDLHHKCENKRCVNPEHLELVVRKEHVRLHRGNKCSR